MIFTKAECELVSGMPNKPGDQDSYEDLMRMDDKEIKFWHRVSKIPNNMEEAEWITIRDDYHERMRIARIEGIAHEKEKLDDIFKHLEVKDLNLYSETGTLPIDVFILTEISDDGSGMIISRKWNEPLCSVYDVWKYEAEAIERDKYYQLANCESLESRYQQYLDYITERKVLTGNTETVDVVISPKNLDIITKLVKEKAKEVVIEKPVVKKRVLSEGDDDNDDGTAEEEDEEGDVVRTDEVIQLDDEIDDTQGDVPDGYIVDEKSKQEGY
jgi:hypothetical protein